MRQCLLSQTKAVLEHMHETAKGRLVNTLDSERRDFHFLEIKILFFFELFIVVIMCVLDGCNVTSLRTDSKK